jgi:hypothetical protein
MIHTDLLPLLPTPDQMLESLLIWTVAVEGSKLHAEHKQIPHPGDSTQRLP